MVSSVNLQTAHKNFLKFLKERNRASATILAYGSDIQQLIDFCYQKGIKTIDQITSINLESFKTHLTTEKYTAKSISRKINSIKTFFKVLVERKIIQKNPSLNLSHPKYKNKPPRILTKMEYRALRDSCRTNIRIAAIIELFLQTGMRIGELAKLEIEDFKKNVLKIKAWQSRPAREIPLNKAAQNSLKSYLQIRPKSRSKTLFLTKTGKPFLVRNIRGSIDRYFKLAGIKDATINDLRHTFITQQLKTGAPLVLISKIVGHKRLSTTEKYLQFIKKNPAPKMKLKEL